ncbi:MAG: ABC transporter permease [Myxococcales bacterium]
MLKDLEYALRALKRSPGFAAAAVLSLALGLGANTALFSAVDAALLRPLAFHDPDRLMLVWSVAPRYPTMPSAIPDLRALREQSTTLEGLAGYYSARRNLAVPGGDAQRILVDRTTADLPRVLGVSPERGRYFDASEETHGNHHVTVLSHRLAAQLGAGPGATVLLDGEPTQVVGVMPAWFSFDDPQVDAWTPISFEPKSDMLTRGNHFVEAVARLKRGVSIEAAKADVQRIAASLAAQFPENVGMSATLQPLRESISGSLRPALLLLLGAVGLVLLIACANLANLLLARGAARSREIAVRAALGATRARLVRQLLTESVLLALAGGVLGCGVAVWALSGISALGGDLIARLPPLRLDLRVLGFALVLSTLTGLAFGLAPALLLSRHSLSEALKESAPGLSPRSGRLRSALVVAEVALSVVLLSGAGLLLRSLDRLRAVDPGFHADRVLTGNIALPAARYDTDEKQLAFFRDALDRVRALPGVKSAGIASTVPFDNRGWGKYMWAEEHEPQRLEDVSGCDFQLVSGDYFGALGIAPLRGRLLDDPSQHEVVINETAARTLFADQDPIGRRISINPPERLIPPDRNEPVYPRYTVVGLVRDVRRRSLEKPPVSQVWMRVEQLADQFGGNMYFVLRFEGDAGALGRALKATIASLDPTLAVSDLKTMDERLGGAVSKARFSALLLSLFAGLALLLAMLGVYAVMAYSVAQRTREIGVRLALGAAAGDVLRLIFRQGSLLVVAGLAIGIAATLAGSKALAALLFGISGTDPATYFVAAAILAVVAAVALYLPARRASRLHPAIALRAE